MNIGLDGEVDLEKLIFKMLHISKKWIPLNSYYNFIFFSLKVIGYVIDSHTFLSKSSSAESTDGLFLTSYLQNICYYKSLDDYSNINTFDYNILIFLIYLLSVMPYVIFYTVFIKRKVNKHRMNFSYWEKLALKFNGFVFSISVFLFQHMIEILCFMYLNTYINLFNSQDIPVVIKTNFLLFDNSLFLEKYLYLILNSVTIILLNLSMFLYFKLLNEPYFNSNCSFKFLHNNFFIILLIISFNLQGFHYFFLAFIGTTQNIIKIFFIGVCIITAILYMIVYSMNYNFNMFAFRLILVIYIEGLYNGIIDIIFGGASNIVLSSMQYYLKISLVLISAFVTYFMIQNFKQNYYKRKISSYIFNKNKITKSSVIYALVELYKNAIEEKQFLVYFLQIINSHKFSCTSQSCGCHKFKLDKFKNKMQKYLKIDVLNLNEKLTKFSQIYEDLLILCDFQISNSIHNKHKYDDPNDFSLFILYIDFVFYFKRNPAYSNYLIDQYSRKLTNMPFFIRYYFINYKRKIIKLSNNKANGIKSDDASTSTPIDINFRSFIEYQTSINLVNRYMNKTCNDLSSLVAFKSRRDSKIKSKLLLDDNNIDIIHGICRKLNKSYAKLIKYLTKYFTIKPLRNFELCYLLTQYFELVTIIPPIEVSNLFDTVSSFSNKDDETNCQQYLSSFNDKGVNNPILISSQADEDDKFIVEYISQKLCDDLNFKLTDVLGKDFHIFLPTEFIKEHKVLIKKTILLQNINSFKKSTFMLTKDRYLLQVELKVIFMPTFESQIMILIDVTPNIHLNKESTKSFKFILDYNSQFISHTKKFEEKYELSVEMMKKIQMDFQSLFNLDFNKYKNRITKNLNTISNIDMRNLENLTKPYKSLELKNALKYRNDIKMASNFKIKKFSDVESERILIFIKRKDKILKGLRKLKNAVEDFELDPNYSINILNLEKHLYMFSTINKLTPLRDLANPKRKNNLINFFKIKISICSIGNLPYFYAKVYDCDIQGTVTGGNYSNINNNIFPSRLKSEITNNPSYHNEIKLVACKKNISEDSVVRSLPRSPTIHKEAAHNFSPPSSFAKKASLKRRDTFCIFIPKKRKEKIKFDVDIEKDDNKKILRFVTADKKTLDSQGHIASGPLTQNSQNLTNLSSTNFNLTSSNNLLLTSNFQKDNLAKNSSFINLGNKKEGANKNAKDGKDAIFNKIIHSSWNSILNLRNKKSKNHKQNNSDKKPLKINHTNNRQIRVKNIMEKFLLICMICFLTLILVLSLMNFFLKSNHLEVSKIYTNLNFYSITIKASILYSNALVIMGCENVDNLYHKDYDNLRLSYQDFSKLFYASGEDLMSDIFNFEHYLMESSDQLYIKKFIAQKDDYKILYQDWNSYMRSGSLITDELKMFHFYIASLQDVTGKMSMCRIRDFFMKINNENKTTKYGDSSKDSTPAEFTLFYIIQNVFPGMRDRLNYISLIASNLMSDYLTQNKLSATVFNAGILFVFILLNINLYVLFNNFCIKFDLIMESFYFENEKEPNFINRLELFRKILREFDRDDLEKFEKEKISELEIKEIESEQPGEPEHSKQEKILDNMKNKFLRRTTIGNDFRSSHSNIVFKNLFVDTNQNSIGENQTNQTSLNNQATGLGRASIIPKQNKRQLNNNSALSLKSSSSTLNESNVTQGAGNIAKMPKLLTLDSVEEDTLEKNLKLDIPLLKYGIYFLIFSIFLYISLTLVNSLYNIQEFQDLIIQGEISTNFIERFTNLFGMLIYYKLSLIEGNPNYIIRNFSDYSAQDYANYFNVNQSFEDDSIFTVLKNSEFSHFYHMIYLNTENLDIFINSNEYSYLLPNVREYENKIRKNSEFCYNLAFGYINRANFENFQNSLEAYISMNEILVRCKKFGSEIQQHGINTAMDLIVTSIKNMYLDYYQDKPYNYNSSLFHISQPKLVQLFNGVTVTFRELQKNFISLINDDMNAFYDSIINVEFFFSISILSLNCVFIAVIFFVFIKKFRWYFYHLKNGIDKYLVAANN